MTCLEEYITILLPYPSRSNVPPFLIDEGINLNWAKENGPVATLVLDWALAHETVINGLMGLKREHERIHGLLGI